MSKFSEYQGIGYQIKTLEVDGLKMYLNIWASY